MRKFNQVFKEKQVISEKILEGKLLNEFKDIYSDLLEQYQITKFDDLDENTQVAFLRELNEYWSEDTGLSKKGLNFLKTKSSLLTEDSTPLQKVSYLRNKSTIVISEALRQVGIKEKLYDILNEMFKNTKSTDISDVLSTDVISGTILESFGTSLQDLMTEIVYELSSESENINEETGEDGFEKREYPGEKILKALIKSSDPIPKKSEAAKQAALEVANLTLKGASGELSTWMKNKGIKDPAQWIADRL